MTTHAVRTNRLAMISFASGLLALLCIAGMLIAMSLAPTDYDLVGTLTSGVLLPLRDLSVLVALVTGILALREIKQKRAPRGEKRWRGWALRLAWAGLCSLSSWLWHFGCCCLQAAFLRFKQFAPRPVPGDHPGQRSPQGRIGKGDRLQKARPASLTVLCVSVAQRVSRTAKSENDHEPYSCRSGR